MTMVAQAMSSSSCVNALVSTVNLALGISFGRSTLWVMV